MCVRRFVIPLFFAEGVTKTELLAIRFGTPENAAQFKVCALVGRKILWIH
jgi:hypothetical protein